MANYYTPGGANPQYGGQGGAQNLQFYSSSYAQQPVSGTATPAQSSYGYGAPGGAYASSPGFGSSFGGAGGVSGRMGEQGGLRTGWVAAFSTEGYDSEPPLLEELGVNFRHIQAKTLAVLNPFTRIDQHLMDDSDLAGPLLFCLLFGFFLLFSGKVHFGYIYGLALLGSTSLHWILSLMSPDEPPAASASPYHPAAPVAPSYPDPSGVSSSSAAAASAGPGAMAGGGGGGHGHLPEVLSPTLTFPRSASVLGYCLLPLVATSLVGIAMPMDTPLGWLLTVTAIAWCTVSASGMFCAVGRMRAMRGLVMYPLALFYVGFGIMSVFSSRGSGSLNKLGSG